jgi:1,2-diacylglycerol 3-alpha-glucosyltransferase
MRILHCCLAGQYVDGLGYQETILAKMHKTLGHDVEVVASTEVVGKNGQFDYQVPRSYVDEHNINVTRIAYTLNHPRWLVRKMRWYKGLNNVLVRFKPDVLFVHDGQFLNAFQISRYAKRNGIRLLVDCHTDSINSASGFLSRRILHGLIYRACVRSLERVAERFYATLPLRADFLHEVYGVDRQNISLLPFGVDDELLENLDRCQERTEIRSRFNLSDDHIVFVAGGKLDRLKNVHVLAEAFLEQRQSGRLKQCKLVIFGEPDSALAKTFATIGEHEDIIMLGWKTPQEIVKLLIGADCVFFPGTHSVLWEVALGLGLPCVLRHWPGMQHFNWGANSILLKDPTVENLGEIMLRMSENPSLLETMATAANAKQKEMFSYRKIAFHSLIRGFEMPGPNYVS